MMNRRLRLTRSTQRINFLLENLEKNLEEYKKAIELKDKQLSDINFFCRVLKKATTQLKVEIC